MGDPFEGKTVEEFMEMVRKDWQASVRRATYINERMDKAEFLAEAGGGTLSEAQLKTFAMLVAALARAYGGGMKLHDVLPMVGYLWSALEDVSGNLHGTKPSEPTIRMAQQKGVH